MISAWKIVWVSIVANLLFVIVVSLVLGTATYKILGGQAGMLKIQDMIAREEAREAGE